MKFKVGDKVIVKPGITGGIFGGYYSGDIGIVVDGFKPMYGSIKVNFKHLLHGTAYTVGIEELIPLHIAKTKLFKALDDESI